MSYLNFQEKKMNKKLVFGLALALVLFSGSYFYAQADCGCVPKISTPSCLSCGARDMDRAQARDMDRSEATCQGAYSYGPSTPEPMGAPGAY
jgi:hypothetical protein